MENSSPTAKTQSFFQTDHLKADLKGRSVRGGAVTLVSQAIKFALQMGSTVILARLLTPGDYGIFGMATVITGFVELFKDLGLSQATIQKAEVNHQQVSTLFWINVAVSIAIAIIVAALAPVVAWFYDEPRLTLVTIVLSTNFILGGLIAQHQAILRRQMQFTSLARIEVLSMAVGLVVAVIIAWLGGGYWSLIGMIVATGIANLLGVWLACAWRPGWISRDAEIGSMLSFGGHLTGFRCVNYFSRNLDNILIGRIWGPQALGFYAKAYQIVLLPIQKINVPVTSVALPALSSLQSEPEQYRRYYYKAILAITVLGMPIICLLFASADKVILLLLGEQWLEVIPIFRFLMPAALISTFNVATGWAYQSLGHTDRQFRWGLFSSAVYVTIFIISVRWGAIGVAAAYGLSQPLLLWPSLTYCYKGTPLKTTEFFKTILIPLVASIGSALLLMGANAVFKFTPYLVVNFAIDCVLYGLFFLGIWLLLPNGRNLLKETLLIIKSLRSKPKRA